MSLLLHDHNFPQPSHVQVIVFCVTGVVVVAFAIVYIIIPTKPQVVGVNVYSVGRAYAN